MSTETATPIVETAIQTRLTIGMWRAQKSDKRAAKTVSEKHHNDVTMGNFRKRLLQSKNLSAYQRNAEQARDYMHKMTLPWGDGGIRLLPSSLFYEFNDEMRSYKKKANKYMERFLAEYDECRDHAKQRLGELFDPNDYPSPERLRTKFYFEIHYMPVPTANDWRVAEILGEEENLKSHYDQVVQQQIHNAMQDVYQRLYDVVSDMYEKFSDENKIIRQPMFENARKLVDLLPKLNVMGDPTLDKLIEDMRLNLCGYDADDIKLDLDAREQATKDAEDILNRMSAAFGGLGGNGTDSGQNGGQQAA